MKKDVLKELPEKVEFDGSSIGILSWPPFYAEMYEEMRSNSLHFETFYKDRIALGVPKGHPLAGRERISNAEATKAVLDEKLVKVDAKIGEEGQLFGSVTSQQIVEAIKAQLGVDVDRKRIVRGATIKTAGRHAVEINLYRDINAKVVVLVGDEPVAEEPAAEEAAEPEATEAADEAAETTEAAE